MWLVPSIVLVAIAIHHRWRMLTCHQGSWKGGGFAMFSDIPRNMVTLEILVDNEDGERATRSLPVQTGDGELERLFDRASHIPTERNLLAVARRAARMQWTACGEIAHPTGVGQRPLEFESVRITHYRWDFDARRGVYSATSVSRHHVDALGDGSWLS